MRQLSLLYERIYGHRPDVMQKMPGAGSNRTYYRLADASGDTVVGVVGTSVEENRAFVAIARHFCDKGLPVPKVLAVSDDAMRYIQTDLGERSLFDALQHGRAAGGDYGPEETDLLVKTIRLLPQLQVRGAEGMDWSVCYPLPQFDRQSVMFDLNYFKYCFLKPVGLDFHEARLEEDFCRMADDLVEQVADTFLYRDFQARNVMLDHEGCPSFIDFQGGRKGPFYYDVASFVWQASAKYPDTLRQLLVDEYYDALRRLTDVPERQSFDQKLSLFVLFRTLQVLGAYGFRGYFERKRHFIDSIPPAMDNLRTIIEAHRQRYPYLVETLQRLADMPRFAPKNEKPTGDGLVVKVWSFSYKKGIPEDESGNGGGYVFDCRSTHNPGRYKPYKSLTGLDLPVVKFLEDDGEILAFLKPVYQLADAHVARYIQRGFTNLMFAFGCTGGQHRSVYSAQHLAQHIHEKFGVEVRVTHREQGVCQVMEARQPAAPMQAMVFAAGLGTRLRPLTDTMPKAMVPVAGKPLLEHTLQTLRKAGARRVVVNVHHMAGQIVDYLEHRPLDELDIRVSDESDALLETGGGLRKALPLFRNDAPVLIHNVDILSNVDLADFYEKARHEEAALLVSERKSSRYLLFDDDMCLVGWRNATTGQLRTPHQNLDLARCRQLAFSGIHVLSPQMLQKLDAWPERFPIVDFYLDACASCRIRGIVKHDLRLIDVGKTDTLAVAEDFLHSLHNSSDSDIN